jgi:hypothetical protein
MSGVTFIYVIHVGHSTLADHGWRPDPQGGRHRRLPVDGGRSRISVSTRQGLPLMFITLMTDALGSPLASSWGPVVDVS